MDPSLAALVGFLVVAVGVAGVVLWPRFRESLGARDPVVPGIRDALLDDLQAHEGDAARALVQALRDDPIAVRQDVADWRRRLADEGVSDEVLELLLRL